MLCVVSFPISSERIHTGMKLVAGNNADIISHTWILSDHGSPMFSKNTSPPLNILPWKYSYFLLCMYHFILEIKWSSIVEIKGRHFITLGKKQMRFNTAIFVNNKNESKNNYQIWRNERGLSAKFYKSPGSKMIDIDLRYVCFNIQNKLLALAF